MLKKTAINHLLPIIFIISLSVLIISIGFLHYNDRVLLNGEKISFIDENGDKLHGTYYGGSINAGIIVLAGFGGSQTSMRGFSSEFGQQGFHVFTFDFSGHSQSPGGVYMDNAQTDRFARQLLSGIELFKSESGLTNDQIILLGHSMGGRVAMQSQTLNENNISGIIFIGGQIDLKPNSMSQMFTGTNDSEIEWIQNLRPTNPEADILIITGEYDDVLPPESAEILIDKLGGITESPYIRDLHIIDRLTHTFEIFNVEVVSRALNFGIKILGIETNPNYSANTMQNRIILWIIGAISLFTSTILLILIIPRYIPKIQSNEDEDENRERIDVRIIDSGLFIRRKLLYWLPSFVISIVIILLLAFIPIGYPIFGTPFAGIFGGLGIFMLVWYHEGRTAGTSGTMEFTVYLKNKTKKLVLRGNKRIILLLVFGMLYTLIITFFLNSGLFYVFPLNERLIWLIITTPIATTGFFIIQKERNYIENSSENSAKDILLVMLIDYLPIVLLSIVALVGGPTTASGLIQFIVIILLILTLGELFRKVTENTILIGITQAFILQYISLAFGPIFYFF
ncbi:MAG: alpha/beta fold hydrolase [Candidatus Lokiarchaeota archaeon]|nr:alpha/beta fold hydrolase [Candidatus Lokiarchaeota archaeon]